ncbi:DUF4252 domain-containing protein [Neptunitalea lumnitzerae]|nr:DUF4252 domain-containing protein [Neptunitalea sp. Y10]
MEVIAKYLVKLLFIIMLLVFSVSCDVKGGELQEYLVDKSAQPEFLSLDVATSIFDVSKTELTPEEKEIYKSLRKLNIVMLRANQPNFTEEKETVSDILKGEDFEELMSFNSNDMKGKLYYIGDEDSIDEVVIYGYNKEDGFALVRILGDNFKIENMGKLVQILQSSQVNGNPLKPLQDFFGEKKDSIPQ